MVAKLSGKLFGSYLHDGKVGVMDIGSNSIRLVIYDGTKRVPLPIYSEKAFCGLAKGLGATNRLNPVGVRLARVAIARFLATVKLMDVVELHIVATAAVRDSDDGRAFVKELERTHQVKIRVISGKKEAQYAAYGILSSHSEPNGLVADLGGGSLELTSLDDIEMSMHDTLPLGPLRLLDKAGHDRTVMREVIQQQLARLGWLGEKSYPCLYGIGGSFRAIAKIHMQENNYPLTLLHDYEIETGAAMELLERLVTWPEEKIMEIPTAEKRQNQLPAAAMIMQELLTVSKAEKVVFSTSGIREGLLYSLLSPYLRNEDPLISSCAELAGQNGRHPGYPSELYEWMDLAFKDETEAERRLRAAACILSELAWRIHRSSRGAWVYHRIIQSSLVGISHVERVALATALYHRYQPVWKEDWRSYSLLNDRWRNWAQAVGSAMSLAYYLSGGLPGNLGYVVLKPERGRPRLRMAREIQPLQGEKLDQLLDRFATASSAYNRPESAIAE